SATAGPPASLELAGNRTPSGVWSSLEDISWSNNSSEKSSSALLSAAARCSGPLGESLSCSDSGKLTGMRLHLLVFFSAVMNLKFQIFVKDLVRGVSV